MNICYFNNNSSENLGLLLENETLNNIPKSTEIVYEHEEETGGVFGGYTIKYKKYKDRVFTLSFYSNTENKDNIYRWFNDIKDNRMYFNKLADRCYIVKTATVKSVTIVKKDYNKIDVEFICFPFMADFNYKRTEIVTPDNFTAKTIFIDGTFGALTKFKVRGTDGYCKITVNGELCELNNLNKDKAVIVDSKKLIAYEEESKAFKSCSNFINLKSGKNEIIINAVSRPTVTLEYLNLYY